MSAADRALLGIILACAVGLFLLASGSRTAPIRVLGFFLAATLAWGGIAYSVAVTSAPETPPPTTPLP